MQETKRAIKCVSKCDKFDIDPCQVCSLASCFFQASIIIQISHELPIVYIFSQKIAIFLPSDCEDFTNEAATFWLQIATRRCRCQLKSPVRHCIPLLKPFVKISEYSFFVAKICHFFLVFLTSRNGLKKDLDDLRTDPLQHIISLLPQLTTVQYLLVENVKGFETSEARNMLITCLRKLEYNLQEFILSPHQFGVLNTRHRYYLLAKKSEFFFQTSESVVCLCSLALI